jgi:acetyl esterase/lipase
MKRALPILALFVFTKLAAQPCNYSEKKYAIREKLRIFYGAATNFSGGTDSLWIDIFYPVGDKNTKRPIMLFVHGGGFSGGNYKDVTTQAKAFAQRGFVAATASYRLGFFRPVLPNQYPWALDKSEPERAAYRAMVDIKGAVRFLNGRAAIDSSDMNEFFIGGFSAGAITSLNVALVQTDTYKPASSGAISSVSVQGNTYQRPDLGGVQGSLNMNGTNTLIKGVLNYFGGVWDTLALEAAGSHGNPGIFSYHQTGDPVVPANVNRPWYGLGMGISDNYPLIWGSIPIDAKLKRMNYPARKFKTYIHTGNSHDVHNAAMLDTMTASWVSSLICNPVSAIESISKETVLRRVQTPDKIQILAEKDCTVSFYTLSGRLISKVVLAATASTDIPPGTGLIRYDSKNGQGAFLCSPQ